MQLDNVNMEGNDIKDSLLYVAESESEHTIVVNNNLEVNTENIKHLNSDDLEEMSEANCVVESEILIASREEGSTVCATKSAEVFADTDKSLHTDDTNGIEHEKCSSKIIIHTNIRLDTLTDLKSQIEENTEVEINKSNCKKKRLNVLDSDSETENEIIKEQGQFSGEIVEQNISKNGVVLFDSDSEDERVVNQLKSDDYSEQNSNFENQIQQKLKGLCDSDTASESDDNTEKQLTTKQKSKKAPIKSAKHKIKENFKSTQMTAKQAAKEKQEIQAESQRRIREAKVSLPYHKPKNRTITEFLKMRPCLATAIPVTRKIPASIAIKMSEQELELMSKKLEERKKEVEEFYKSESDSDDDKENCQKGDMNILEQSSLNENIVSSFETTEKPGTKHSEVVEEENIAKENNSSEKEDNSTVTEVAEVKMAAEDVVDSDIKNPEQVNDGISEIEQNNQIFENKIIELNKQNNDKTEQYNNLLLDKENNEEFNMCNSNEMEEQSHEINDSLSKDCVVNLEESESNKTQQEHRLHILIDKYSNKNEIESIKPKSRLALLQEKLAKTKPKLNGNPNDVIDLDDGVVQKNEITHLMERFIKHIQPHHVKNNDLQISVINVSQGEIHKEILTVPHDEDDTPAVVNEKPGAKLQKLREELQSKILQQRAEMWQKKKQQVEENKIDDIDVKEGFEDEILDNEEEEELTESEEEEEEEEYILEEKKRNKKSAFLDEEAQVSGEENEEDEDENEEKEEEEEEEEVVEEINENEEDVGANEIEETMDSEIKKPRKRILNTFDEDSNSNDQIAEDAACSDTSPSWEDDGPPPHQKQLIKTPAHNQMQVKTQMGFLSPVINITGLQGNSKFQLESPIETQKSLLIPEPSPLKDQKWQSQLQKKLFEDNTQTDSETIPTNTQFEAEETQPTTQDLENICSGNFTETTQSDHNKIETVTVIDETGAKVDDEDEMFITQILNEDEMEKFKQKFISPITKTSFSHADDESDEEESFVQNKRKRKRLVFSDDEDESEDVEEMIALHDEDDEISDGAEVVDYDSEENEIVETVIEKGDSNLKLKDFLENEAELSGSDWDSEDEDEKGLDVLEKEEGDEEKFDEDQLKKDLEKIHMRRILDQDTREVRMLQEILLDDGELHGSGRQRQFRWRNINDDPEEENRNSEEVDVYFDEDETEEEWRRKRLEREMFLKKEMEKSQRFCQNEDTFDESTDSEILKLGQAALKKSQQNTPNDKIEEKSTVTKAEPFIAAFSSKRGSFLTRAESVLTRIAEMTKVSTEVATIGAKSTKNVVFHSLQNNRFEGKSFIQQIGKKRKGVEGTPRRLKKLRMETTVVD